MSETGTTCDICKRPMDRPRGGMVKGVLSVCDNIECMRHALQRDDLCTLGKLEQIQRDGPMAREVPLDIKLAEVADTLSPNAQRLLLCTLGLTRGDDGALAAGLGVTRQELADARAEIARGIDAWNEANRVAGEVLPR